MSDRSKRHPDTILVFKEDMDSFLACLEACLSRAEQLAKTRYVLEIEPGGAELWHVPQVRAMTPWTQDDDDALRADLEGRS